MAGQELADGFIAKFSESLSKAFRIEAAGDDRYRVFTPFVFDDGDYPSVVIKREADGWKISDEGFTCFHFADDVGNEDWERFVADTLAMWRIEDRDGAFVMDMEGSEDYCEAIVDFGQALTAIAAASRLLRSRRD